MSAEGREPDLDPELVAAIDSVDGQLVAQEPHGDLAAKLEWVIKLLVMRGILNDRHQKIIKRHRASRSLPLVFARPEEEGPDPDIDCAARLHLCRARCCSFKVSLTEAEIRGGKVPWNLHEPYTLPKNPETGYCAHLADTGGCTVYEHRPGICRKYDCRSDKRVWEDFEARIPTAMPWDVAELPWLGKK
jgi:hypothetical protein